ncbi:MAG: HesA/MoeB/ThiF family protein [Aeromonadaceae bacterium]
MSELSCDAMGSLDDSSWLRYGRQLLLPELGEAGQRRIQDSRVLIVGLGGLGSPVALYLAAAGVGQLWLSDGDVLELSNLQRQILYTSADCGKAKGELAVRQLRQLNPQVSIQAVAALGEENWSMLLQPDGVPVDLVLDCSDNMVTRQLVNRACVARQIPLLSAAVSGWQGTLALFDFRGPRAQSHGCQPHGCYHCLYPTQQEPSLSCATAGVLGPAAGVIGSLQALEALKFLAGMKTPALGRLSLFDALQGSWRQLRLTVDPGCRVCAHEEELG